MRLLYIINKNAMEPSLHKVSISVKRLQALALLFEVQVYILPSR